LIQISALDDQKLEESKEEVNNKIFKSDSSREHNQKLVIACDEIS